MRWVPDRPSDPPERSVPVCPVCGQECGTFYRDLFNEIVGCDECIKTEDADEEQMDRI